MRGKLQQRGCRAFQLFPTVGWSIKLVSSVLLALTPFNSAINPPMLLEPEPEVVFVWVFGERTAESPKWTTPPPTVNIWTGPIKAGIASPFS